jgi:hypothetical protein
MNEEKLKNAFQKIKKEIQEIKEQIYNLSIQIQELKLVQNHEKTLKNHQKNSFFNQTNQTHIPTHPSLKSNIPTHIPTHQQPLEALKPQNIGVSIGNRGVPTDRQTDRQTNQQTDKWPEIHKNQVFFKNTDDFEKAKEILDNLDSIKKQIRLKFKRLTNQEMLVFSTLYALDILLSIRISLIQSFMIEIKFSIP